MANSEGYHEPLDRLAEPTIDHHRALTSIMEELEAIDWYEQRIDATTEPDLAAILRHNADEEREHAAMLLEWLRRRDPELSRQLQVHLFREGPIEEENEGEHEGQEPGGSLSIGSLRAIP